jgi:hypothetical protein
VNGEAMTTWGMKNEKMGLTYDQIVMLILKEAGEVVKDSMKAIRDEIGGTEELKLRRIENELFYFFVFAIDYWWQNEFRYTKEQKSIFEKIFSTHLDIMCGDEAGGRAMWDDLQERFTAYSEIVNEEADDAGKLWRLGTKVSEYCEIEGGILLVLIPELFRSAMLLVSTFEAET